MHHVHVVVLFMVPLCSSRAAVGFLWMLVFLNHSALKKDGKIFR